ncbi:MULTISPECIES: P1 family peptidase [unclassified Bradyrhizobium]|uniref:DmpA family aminopeptidase n=1 Tax=unclassified Bradyrhizobium TaxID=2631580 RepID=UPI0028E1BD19|nr:MULTISPECIES: P1 family peptidase [unclassified Bradyrhizobium]
MEISKACDLASEGKPRARELGVPFDGTPGPNNTITDVAGIEVGMTTLIQGDGLLVRGRGPVRTGVTIIFPLGKHGKDAVAAGRAVINGTGEFTGLHVVDEVGLLFGPIALTGTGNLSVVHQGLIDWSSRPGFLADDHLITRLLPVVGETLDSRLNDVHGRSLKLEHVFAAMDNAGGGPVPEGNVGGGTGMTAYQFKGGTGTSSRVVAVKRQRYTVGVLVQANHGRRSDLRIAGMPIGHEITDLMPNMNPLLREGPAADGEVKNSLLIVIATDAPLQPHQLQRLARRAALGVGREGSTAATNSGEFSLAFSTTNTTPLKGKPNGKVFVSDNEHQVLDALFKGTVEAVEEALVNQLVASETMSGANGSTIYALPHDRLVSLLHKYNRYAPSGLNN